MAKLPEITLFFWIMKICVTTLGETAGDLMSMTLHVGYALSSLALLGIFLVTLRMQLMAASYRPSLYWTVILSTSTVGTTMSDYMDRTLGLGYATGSAIVIFMLCCVFALWRRREGTVSILSINSRRAEGFYWTATLFSNTLGTALGDFLSDDSGLGFDGGAVLIGSVIGLIILLYYLTDVSRIFLFWAAFVLTRPLGATMGDLLTKPYEKGGLDFGTFGASAVLAAMLLACILTTVRKGGPSGHGAAPVRRIISTPHSRRLACARYSLTLLILTGGYEGVLFASGNFHEVISGQLYRSGQPSAASIAAYGERYHIRTILNLRGKNKGTRWYDEEAEAAGAHHVRLIDFRMTAKRELSETDALSLIEIMKDAPKPLLIHCDSGSDRSGLAVALYLAAIAGQSEFAAELQLSPLYGHFPLRMIGAPAMNATFERMEPLLGYSES